MKFVYPVCFYPSDEGGYWVNIPDLPCNTQGETLVEAMEMAADAAAGFLSILLDDGETPPIPSKPNSIVKMQDDGIISLILVNMDAYAKANSSKSIKKTLTIPAWLNTLAEKKKVNFSHILQKGLADTLGFDLDA